jgi:RNA polymerase sigma factor (sigma-70 family)
MDGVDQQTPLGGMSERQRRIVESNLPLVRLTLRRHRNLARPPRRVGREAGELLQEGCLALVEAVRSHDPRRHGDFAAFAMSRIHQAMSRFIQENRDSIRVPYITRRRRKQQRKTGEVDRHCPDALPRVVGLRRARMTASQLREQRVRAESAAGGSVPAEGVKVGELIRERYDRAVARAVSGMKESPRATVGYNELLERCCQERWTVPEPDAKTPIRQMARELGCSTGRITHCEDRWRSRVAAILLEDETWRKLVRLARRPGAGMEHRLTAQELDEIDHARL